MPERSMWKPIAPTNWALGGGADPCGAGGAGPWGGGGAGARAVDLHGQDGQPGRGAVEERVVVELNLGRRARPQRGPRQEGGLGRLRDVEQLELGTRGLVPGRRDVDSHSQQEVAGDR